MSDLMETASSIDGYGAGATMNAFLDMSFIAPAFTYDVTCIGPDGLEKWHETFHNTVTTVGKTDIVDKYLKGSAYTASWFLGLKGTGSAVAGDTMASHSGWTEIAAYSNATRPAVTFGTTTAGSNTASGVTFNMNGSYTVAGAFLITNSTISGTTGTLYSAGDFATPRSGGTGDTVIVTPTYTVS